MWVKLKERILRRPVRVAEALFVLAGALGWVIAPEAQEAILYLIGLVLLGSEVAQTQTTSKHDPRDDQGRKLEPRMILNREN